MTPYDIAVHELDATLAGMDRLEADMRAHGAWPEDDPEFWWDYEDAQHRAFLVEADEMARLAREDAA